jgi:hypothetical protein
MSEEIIITLAKLGPAGLALALGWIYYKSKLSDSEARVKEHKTNQDTLICLVEKNTEVMTELKSAVSNCGTALQQNTTVIQRLLEKN